MKPKRPVLKFILRPDVYPYSVAFWFGKHDDPAMQRWVHRHGLGNGDRFKIVEGDVAACWDMHGSSLIWVKWGPNRTAEAAALVHESVHAAFDAGHYLGFIHSTKSEEFYTYLIQYLVMHAMRELGPVWCSSR